MVGQIQRELWQNAVEQYGFVTTNDARELEIDTVELRKLSTRGQLKHVTHGVYRFPQFPVADRDDYMLAVLWTGLRAAALSHDTALAVHELCDINPDRIHLSVPKTARIRRRDSALYNVHYTNLNDGDIGWWEGIKTVRPQIAIEQGIATNVPSGLLRQAIAKARANGQITDEERLRLTTILEQRK